MALALIAVLGCGVLLLMGTSDSPTVKAALVASDLKQNILADKPVDTLRLLHEYLSQAEALAGKTRSP